MDDDWSDLIGKGFVLLLINYGVVMVIIIIKRESKLSEEVYDDDDLDLLIDLVGEGRYRGYMCWELRRMSLNSGGVGLRVDGMVGGYKMMIMVGFMLKRLM